MTSNAEIVELAFERLPGTGGGASAGFSFLLVHGWGRSRSDWSAISARLSVIAPVVAVDLRGHGASEAGADMHLAHVAGDVRAVAERLGVESVVVVGHSAGSEVAAWLAREDPQRFAGLVVIDPAFGFPDSDRERISAMSERLRTEEPEKVAAEHFQRLGPSPLLPRLPESGGVLAATPEAATEMFAKFAFGPDALRFASQARSFFRRFPVPILAFYSSEQRARIARDILASARAEVMVLPGGHWTHHEFPEAVVDAVGAWSAAHLTSPSARF